MPVTDPDRRRRLISLTLLGVITVLAGLGALWAYRSLDATSAVRRGSELQACRSLSRADIDAADSAADLADGRADRAEGVTDDLFQQGLVAALTDADVEQILSAIPAARAAALDARAQALEARLEVAATTGRYIAAIDLSRTDPDRFLEDCEARR